MIVPGVSVIVRSIVAGDAWPWMVPIATCASNTCSTCLRSSALPPQAPSRYAHHWLGECFSTAVTKIVCALSGCTFMANSIKAQLYSPVRRMTGGFLIEVKNSGRNLSRFAAKQFATQPCSRISPMAIGGCQRDTECDRRLIQSQAGEISELDQRSGD